MFKSFGTSFGTVLGIAAGLHVYAWIRNEIKKSEIKKELDQCSKEFEAFKKAHKKAA